MPFCAFRGVTAYEMQVWRIYVKLLRPHYMRVFIKRKEWRRIITFGYDRTDYKEIDKILKGKP